MIGLEDDLPVLGFQIVRELEYDNALHLAFGINASFVVRLLRQGLTLSLRFGC